MLSKLQQMGSYGGGNHFGEANTVSVLDQERDLAHHFGLRNGCTAFLSHCGSRGFGYYLAQNQFRALQAGFSSRGSPFPAGDRELVYAPLGSPESDDYLDDLALGAYKNFEEVLRSVEKADLARCVARTS